MPKVKFLYKMYIHSIMLDGEETLLSYDDAKDAREFFAWLCGEFVVHRPMFVKSVILEDNAHRPVITLTYNV